jgi:hypothetical protein
MTSACFRVAENRLQTDGCAGKNLRPVIIMMLVGYNRLLETLWKQSLAVIVWEWPRRMSKAFPKRLRRPFRGHAQIHQMMNRLGGTIACPKSCRIDL